MTSGQQGAGIPSGPCDFHPGAEALHFITAAGGARESLCCACNYAKHGAACRQHPGCMKAARGASYVPVQEAVPGKRYRVAWGADGSAGSFEAELSAVNLADDGLGGQTAQSLVFANGVTVGGWAVGMEEVPDADAGIPRPGTVVSA